MSTQAADSKGLHLPDLVIKGFRGIEDLTVSRLGRVNLISGRNGVGKTSLLDAVRVYASRGNYYVLSDVLRAHEELVFDIEEYTGEVFSAPKLESLFYGRGIMPNDGISIGPRDETLRLSMSIALHKDVFDDDFRSLDVKFQHEELQEIPVDALLQLDQFPRRSLSRYSRRTETGPPRILCRTLGPGLLSNRDLTTLWDGVALTDDESRSVDALNLIFANKVQRVASVGNENNPRQPYTERRVVAKLREEDRPVPLKSLGDGAVRLFSVALALANSKDGFLLIDEVENGIHYSLQHDFWKMVMKAAHENNVQVFATTHSWDCVGGFAWAASETEEVDGALIRLQRHRKNGRLRAVEYSEAEIKIAAEHGIEVR